MDWNAMIGQFGVAGVIIAGLVWDRMRLLKENSELQQEVRNLYQENAGTLKEVAASIRSLTANPPATLPEKDRQ